MKSIAAALTLLATAASAQQQLSSANYWDRCYGGLERQPDAVVLNTFYVVPPAPSPYGAPVSSSGAGTVTSAPNLGSAGAGAGYAVLVMAVVAVAALPVVVYAFDNEPPPRVLRRFNCASFAFDGWGGVEGGTGSAPAAGIGAARVRFGYRHLATDVQFEASPTGVGSFSAHAVIRPTPKEHLEGGLALGYKRAYLGGAMREGFEVGVPQLYTLWRDRGRELQLELRPGVFITTSKTVDVSLDFAVLIPVLENLSIRVGTRAFSYDLQPMFGVNGGLSLHL